MSETNTDLQAVADAANDESAASVETPAREYRPASGIIDLGRGKGQYLPVESRVLWFRSDYPHGKIETQLIELDRERGFALFKTRVETGEGGVAEGYGSETVDDFRDNIEKASTKSLGRALAALGYGTKGALAEGEVADSPARPPDVGSQGRYAREQAPRSVEPRQQEASRAPRNPDAPASEGQRKMIYALARECGLEAEEMQTWIGELTDGRTVTSKELTMREAGTLISLLQARKATRA